MNASKIYYIITHYCDLTAKHGVNDTEHQIGIYKDIKNRCKGSVYTPYENAYGKYWLDYDIIRGLADRTKKQIDNFFYQ